MKRVLLAVVAVMSLAHTAKADEFACTLEVNGQKKEVVAPYKYNKVAVDLGQYACRSTLGTGFLEIIIYPPDGVLEDTPAKSQSKYSYGSLSHGDATCTCGLQ